MVARTVNSFFVRKLQNTRYSILILTSTATFSILNYTILSASKRGRVVMHIGGMQKLTLLDYPGKVACTVFLSGCNLRCPYCHNPGLVLPDQINAPGMPEADVVSLDRKSVV